MMAKLHVAVNTFKQNAMETILYVFGCFYLLLSVEAFLQWKRSKE